MSADELRAKIVRLLAGINEQAAISTADNILAAVYADPEIAAALRQAQMIADEPYEFSSFAHDIFLARLRKADEQ